MNHNDTKEVVLTKFQAWMNALGSQIAYRITF